MKHERFHMNTSIVLKMGAATNSLFIEGREFPISTDKTKRYEMRRDLIEALKASGYFGKVPRRVH